MPLPDSDGLSPLQARINHHKATKSQQETESNQIHENG